MRVKPTMPLRLKNRRKNHTHKQYTHRHQQTHPHTHTHTHTYTNTACNYVELTPMEELPIYQYDPESLATGRCTIESDSYSFGCFLYELFVGSPFADDKRTTP